LRLARSDTRHRAKLLPAAGSVPEPVENFAEIEARPELARAGLDLGRIGPLCLREPALPFVQQTQVEVRKRKTRGAPNDLAEQWQGAAELLKLGQAARQVEAVAGQLRLDRHGLLEMWQRVGRPALAGVDLAQQALGLGVALVEGEAALAERDRIGRLAA